MDILIQNRENSITHLLLVVVEPSVEVFVNTQLAFLTFLYKISIEVSSKNKVASSGN